MLSFFMVPKNVMQRFHYCRSRFYRQQSDHQKKKYRLAKWNILCRPKNQGGLGIYNQEAKNKVLLSKWLFKFLCGWYVASRWCCCVSITVPRTSVSRLTTFGWPNESKIVLLQVWDFLQYG
jgi:hypothetical protein